MSDFTNTNTNAVSDVQLELAVATERLANARQALSSFRAQIEEDLHEFAQNHLSTGESSFEDLNTILENNELEGLKRSFAVRVRVTYEFEVEVEASNEDAARDDVDNDIDTHISDNVDFSCYDDIDIEATEA